MAQSDWHLKIATDDTLMETRQHGDDSFSFSYYLENFYDYDFHCVDWHWHSEVELLFVRKGTVRALIGREQMDIPNGGGLFVNGRVLHRFEADAPNEVPNVVFSPRLLSPEGSLIDREYIQPVLAASGYRLLLPGTPWQDDVLQCMDRLFYQQDQEHPDHLQTLSQLILIWDQLYCHMPKEIDAPKKHQSIQTARLQRMMQTIHDHYTQAVTLDDIAAAAFISKNTAMQIFQDEIHISPVAYLIQYRLKQAARLLKATEKRIVDIAEETGFNSAGYFCRKFRQLYGVSPEEYRQRF